MQLIQLISQKGKNFTRGLIQTWGWAGLKQWLWDREFAEGRWDFIEKTYGDPVYTCVEKYCKMGNLLDLGCGSGNTGCELNVESYRHYTGVDISEVALNKARQRSAEVQRAGKNRYCQSDILSYVPDQSYDVILFRESVYYIPAGMIPGMFDRYSKYLNPDGVFIVRSHQATKERQLRDLIGTNYKIVERQSPSPFGPVILIFNKK